MDVLPTDLSPEVPPREGHFRICSPLSIYNYATQVQLKTDWLIQTIGAIDAFIPALQEWGYRKKVEYSFCERETAGLLSLAFYHRGGRGEMAPLPDGCLLASEAMNTLALSLLDELRRAGCTRRMLKSLVIMESKHANERIAVLFSKDKPCRVTADALRAVLPETRGVLVVYSDYRSPASVVTEILSVSGETTLTEKVKDVLLRYPFDGFFQNNVPVFEVALDHIIQFVEPESRVIDLYCGVGTIGLAIQSDVSVLGIESHAGMVEFARTNAHENKRTNYAVVAGPVEKMIDNSIGVDDTVIIDPPRAGMHQKALEGILKSNPRRVIYLSCNPVTQARDVALMETYAPIYKAGFDMYPGTLHMESLIVLDRK